MIRHPMLAVSRRWSRREGRTPVPRREFLLPCRPAGHTVIHRHLGLHVRVTRVTAPVSRRPVATTLVTAGRVVTAPAGRAPVRRDVLRLVRSMSARTTAHRAVLRREAFRDTVSRTERTTTTAPATATAATSATAAATHRRAHTRTETRTGATSRVIHRHRVDSPRHPAVPTFTKVIHDVAAAPAEVAAPDLDRLTDRIVDRLDQRLIAHRERFGRAY